MHHLSNEDRGPAGEASGLSRDGGGGRAALPRLSALSGWRLALAIVGLALVAGGDDTARAQVVVDGRPDAVHVEARDVTLREVFDALHAKFNLRYRTDDALDTHKTGIFDGPLQRVTARILDGYDFAMKVTPQGIDVLVLRQNQADGKPVTASATPAPAKPKGSLAQAMTAAQANRYEREHFR